MDREDQAKLLTGAGVVVGIVLFFVLFVKRKGGPPNKVFADITVQANGTDVTYDPELLEDVRRRDFVIWRVKNLSRDRVKVCVTKFKHETHGTPEDPLDDEQHGGGKCRMVRANGSHEIRTRVKNSASKVIYKYSIFLNDAEAVDPRLSIVD